MDQQGGRRDPIVALLERLARFLGNIGDQGEQSVEHEGVPDSAAIIGSEPRAAQWGSGWDVGSHAARAGASLGRAAQRG